MTEDSKQIAPSEQCAPSPAPEDFSKLIGLSFDFYGVHPNEYEFKLDSAIRQAVKDDHGMEGSMLKGVQLSSSSDGAFQPLPLARVRLDYKAHDGENRAVYQLTGVDDGYSWLKFGTDYSEPGTPWFVFEYTPKPR